MSGSVQMSSEQVLEAIDSVTRRVEESDGEFVLRAASNPIGRRVKLNDLQGNYDLSRIAHPTARDCDRVEKYRRATDTICALEGSDGS